MERSREDWLELFQWFHQNPELGNEEFDTTEKIREVLRELGIPILPAPLKTGVIALIRGKRPGKDVCLRADIDALPIPEKTDLPYRSRRAGKMHACGHDFHITTGLCIAASLAARREELPGNVYVLFQPAEEVAGGAKSVVDTGILKNIREFYGFHAEPSLAVGEISIMAGGVMAAADQFAVYVTGKGCHGATPQLGRNPIPVLARVVDAICAQGTAGTGEQTKKVVSVTHIQAGNTWNVIPGEAFLEGTVRSTDRVDRIIIKENLEEICASERTPGVQVELRWRNGPCAVVNDAGLCAEAERIAAKNGLRQVSMPPSMMSEDFGELSLGAPGSRALYVKVGTGKGAPLHSPLFRADPEAIFGMAAFYSELLIGQNIHEVGLAKRSVL